MMHIVRSVQLLQIFEMDMQHSKRKNVDITIKLL